MSRTALMISMTTAAHGSPRPRRSCLRCQGCRLAAPDDPAAVSNEARWQRNHALPIIRDVLRRIPSPTGRAGTLGTLVSDLNAQLTQRKLWMFGMWGHEPIALRCIGSRTPRSSPRPAVGDDSVVTMGGEPGRPARHQFTGRGPPRHPVHGAGEVQPLPESPRSRRDVPGGAPARIPDGDPADRDERACGQNAVDVHHGRGCVPRCRRRPPLPGTARTPVARKQSSSAREPLTWACGPISIAATSKPSFS